MLPLPGRSRVGRVLYFHLKNFRHDRLADSIHDKRRYHSQAGLKGTAGRSEGSPDRFRRTVPGAGEQEHSSYLGYADSMPIPKDIDEDLEDDDLETKKAGDEDDDEDDPED